MEKQLLERYAQLVIKTGVNIQKGQILVISSPIEGAEFTRVVAKAAYKAGAEDVVVNWGDEKFSHIRFLHAPEKVFEEFPQWRKDFYLYYLEQGAAFLSISASDPELFVDVDPNRLKKSIKTINTALKEYQANLMANKNTWCVISIPTASWAKKIFPYLTKEQAINQLWQTIFEVVRVKDKDYIKRWEEHKDHLKTRMEFLNKKNFRSLHYKNALGTDLTIELPHGHQWLGGSEYTPEGVEFVANIPTEEVFTLPKKTGVHGKVVSTKPLNYNGNLITNFSLTFKDGKVVDYQAEEGQKTLQNLLETDAGSSYLGEVALVPYDSPISKLDLLFYNTLFDENASCHLAFGKAYPVCIKDSEKMTEKELQEVGVNDSLIHVDFMIGSKDLEIIGSTYEGEEVAIFKNGNFTF